MLRFATRRTTAYYVSRNIYLYSASVSYGSTVYVHLWSLRAACSRRYLRLHSLPRHYYVRSKRDPSCYECNPLGQVAIGRLEKSPQSSIFRIRNLVAECDAWHRGHCRETNASFSPLEFCLLSLYFARTHLCHFAVTTASNPGEFIWQVGGREVECFSMRQHTRYHSFPAQGLRRSGELGISPSISPRAGEIGQPSAGLHCLFYFPCDETEWAGYLLLDSKLVAE